LISGLSTQGPRLRSSKFKWEAVADSKFKSDMPKGFALTPLQQSVCHGKIHVVIENSKSSGLLSFTGHDNDDQYENHPDKAFENGAGEHGHIVLFLSLMGESLYVIAGNPYDLPRWIPIVSPMFGRMTTSFPQGQDPSGMQ